MGGRYCSRLVKFGNGEVMGIKLKINQLRQDIRIPKQQVWTSLTADAAGESKVSIGGSCRLIDVPMSNSSDTVASDYCRKHALVACVLSNGNKRLWQLIKLLERRQGKRWFQASADAVRQFHWLFEEFLEVVLHTVVRNRYSTLTTSGVSGGYFTYSSVESVLHSDDVRSAIPPTPPEYRHKRIVLHTGSVDSLLHSDDVRSGPPIDMTTVPSQKEFPEAILHGVAWKRYSTPTTSGISGGCLTNSSVESLLHSDDVRSAIPPTPPEYRHKRSVDSLLHSDDVRSGPTIDRTTVPSQKEFLEAVPHTVAWNRYYTPMPSGRALSPAPPEYRDKRSFRRLFYIEEGGLGVSGGCSTYSSVESLLHSDAIRSGPITGTTRVPGQKEFPEAVLHGVGWIGYSILTTYGRQQHRHLQSTGTKGVSGGCFTLSRVDSVPHSDDVQSGRTIDMTRVPAQKEFMEAVSHTVPWNRYYTPTTSCRALSPAPPEYRHKSTVESLTHSDDVRSGQTTDMTRVPAQKEFLEAVSHTVAWNRYYTPTTSCRTLSPAPPEYRHKRVDSVVHPDYVLSATSPTPPEYRHKSAVESLLHSDDILSGPITSTTRVPAQKEFPEAVLHGGGWIGYSTLTTYGRQQHRHHQSTGTKGVSGSCFTWRRLDWVLHSDDVRSATTPTPPEYRDKRSFRKLFYMEEVGLGVSGGYFTYSSVESVLHSDDVWSAIPPTPPEYRHKRRVDWVLHSDDVRSGRTTDMTRVPAQKVRVSGSCFTYSSVESLLHSEDIRSGPITGTTRVPAQKEFPEAVLHGGGWIGYSTLTTYGRQQHRHHQSTGTKGVSGGCFTYSSVESLTHSDDVRSGRTTDMTRVPAQKEFPEAVLHGGGWIGYSTLTTYGRQQHRHHQSTGTKGVSGGWFTWTRVDSVVQPDGIRSATSPTPLEYRHKSSVESLLHSEDIRSGPITGTTRVPAQKEFVEVVSHTVAWNRYYTPRTSGRALSRAPPEYRHKRVPEAVLHGGGWIGYSTLTTYGRQQHRQHQRTGKKGVSGGWFTWTRVDSVVHPDGIRSATSPTPPEYRDKRSFRKLFYMEEVGLGVSRGYFTYSSVESVLHSDDVWSAIPPTPPEYRHKRRVDWVLHSDDVRSGRTTDMTTVPAQKEFLEAVSHTVAWNRYYTPRTSGRALSLAPPEYRHKRSFRKLFYMEEVGLGVSGGYFTYSSLESVLQSDDVWSAIPPTPPEYRHKRLFYIEEGGLGTPLRRRPEFPEAGLHGLGWIRSVESLLHSDDIRSGPITGTTRVPAQKEFPEAVLHRVGWIGYSTPTTSGESEGWFIWSRVDSVVHPDDVRSATSPTTPEYRHKRSITKDRTFVRPKMLFRRVSGGWFTWSRVDSVVHPDDEFLEAVSHTVTWNRYYIPTTSGRALSPAPPEYWHKRSVDSLLHSDDVRSGPTIDMTKVPSQKVHNKRSERRIALKCFSGVPGGWFTSSRVDSVLHSADVRSFRRLVYMEEGGLGVSGGCFTYSSVESLLHSDDIRSGPITGTTRVRAQKEFPEAVLHRVGWIGYSTPTTSGVSGGWFTWSRVESVVHLDDVRSATSPTPPEYRHKSSVESLLHSDDIRSGPITGTTREFPEAVLHRVGWIGYSTPTTSGESGGWFIWSRVDSVVHPDDIRSATSPTTPEYRHKSSVESLLHYDDIRSGPITGTTRVPAQKEFLEAVSHTVAWNRYYIPTTSGRALSPAPPEYWHKRSLDSLLHSDDVRSGPTIDMTKVPSQKVHNKRSERRIALKCFSGVPGGCFTSSRVDSVLHSADVRSGRTTDMTRVPAQKEFLEAVSHTVAWNRYYTTTTSGVSRGCFTYSSVESLVHSDDIRSGPIAGTTREFLEAVSHTVAWNRYYIPTTSGRALSPAPPEYWHKRSLDSLLHSDDVRSGPTIDMTKVPSQKVHNKRSERRIALKCFSGVPGGCFTSSRVDSVLHSADVRSFRRLVYMEEGGLGVSGGCFTYSSVESLLHSDDIRSGPITGTTRVRAQKEFPEAVLHRVGWIRYSTPATSGVSGGWFTWRRVDSVVHPDDVRSATSPTPPEYRHKSSVESLLHSDDIRSGPITGTTRVRAQKEFLEAVSHIVAWNRYYSPTTSGRTLSPAPPEYRHKRSVDSLLHSDDVRSGPTIDMTKVPSQKVHNKRSERRIALKCFSGVPGGCFTSSRVDSVLHSDNVRSGRSTAMTRVPAQKVHN
ncbi:hypothetical protein POTOM_035195 [Populus tomentosa]|uniref:Uncharacterized protein n=1 Tax=Populus tomentosa TaxID=118781 RepID=A0A8X7YSI8_POPTO|nr:hypothetical protein POTOM_035195 [Populus tomentosa]